MDSTSSQGVLEISNPLNSYKKSLVYLSLLVLIVASKTTLSETALTTDRQAIENPANALLQVIERKSSLQAPGKSSGIRTKSAEVAWTTDIAYTNGTIFNPRTGRNDKVRLRSYTGDRSKLPGSSSSPPPFVAPTVNLIPGDTFRLTLNNLLEGDPSCPGNGDVNTPHCFNSTNMHTHGLWISPSGNSDNVLLNINPGTSFTYEYNIPEDHPAGTFWYHPHMHGSTAIQVSSGMAGALIIRGNRKPGKDKTGDIDTLLKKPNGEAIHERIMLMQQIPYACHDQKGRVKTLPPNDDEGIWDCDKTDDVGTIESYKSKVGPNQLGFGTWHRSGRYTSINGKVMPEIANVKANHLERWRFIHAGVRDSIRIQFIKSNQDETALAAIAHKAKTPGQHTAYIEEYCTGETVPQFSLASDGLTHSQLHNKKDTEHTSMLHPGYREDLLMTFPKPGIYCIVDKDAPAADTVSQTGKTPRLLGTIRVVANNDFEDMAPAEQIKTQLIAAAKREMPDSIKKDVIADLEKGLQLSAFIPHSTIKKHELTGYQSLAFDLTIGNGTYFPDAYSVGTLDKQGKPINLSPYDPHHIDRNLKLGGVDEWVLKSFFNKEATSGGHPFHIHVNPFQIVKILDKDGNDMSLPGALRSDGKYNQFAGTQGTWKDTIYVAGDYEFYIRTRYERYIGDFVLHCHILDHEDHGMMQNVRISLPNGKGGLAKGHH